jgi:CDGSH-type Zn-finger protein
VPDVEIEVRESGPYRIRGPIKVVDADGNEYDLSERVIGEGERPFVALCRCGGSSTKPFCDGTHKRNRRRPGGHRRAQDRQRHPAQEPARAAQLHPRCHRLRRRRRGALGGGIEGVPMTTRKRRTRLAVRYTEVAQAARATRRWRWGPARVPRVHPDGGVVGAGGGRTGASSARAIARRAQEESYGAWGGTVDPRLPSPRFGTERQTFVRPSSRALQDTAAVGLLTVAQSAGRQVPWQEAAGSRVGENCFRRIGALRAGARARRRTQASLGTPTVDASLHAKGKCPCESVVGVPLSRAHRFEPQRFLCWSRR